MSGFDDVLSKKAFWRGGSRGITKLVCLFLPLCLVGCLGSNSFEPVPRSPASGSLDSALRVVSVDFTSPEENKNLNGPFTLTGTCANGAPVSIGGDIAAPVSVNCENNQFVQDVTLSVGEGPKSIRVSQIAGSGVLVSAVRTVIKDTMAPTLTIITPNSDLNIRTNVIVQGGCETGLNVQIVENGMSYTVPCANAAFATTLPVSSPDGQLSIVVSQTDLAGNKTEFSRTLRKDTVAPVVAITSPTAGSTVASQATVQGTCESGAPVQVSGMGASAPVVAPCTAGAFSAVVVFSAGAGSKALQVSQTDLAGNIGSANRSFNRQADAAPVVAFTQPAEGTVFQNMVTVSGTCQSGLSVSLSGTGLSAPVNTACSNGMFSASLAFTAGDGLKNVIASQTNAQMLTGSTSRSFVRDNTGPTLTIASPAAGSLHRTSVLMMGACESGLSIQVTGAGAATAGSAMCSNGAYSVSVGFSAGEGSKTIQLSQMDAVGNVTNVNRAFVRDSVAPALTIASPAAGTSAATGITVTGACEGAFTVTASGSGTSGSVSGACAANSYSLSVTFSSGDGNKEVRVSQTDAAGNVATLTRTFVRATPLPVLNGPLLYANNCASCHGALASSTKRGSTASSIQTAIGSVPNMSGRANLVALTSAEVAAIATALAIPAAPVAQACNDPGKLLSPQFKRLTAGQFANSIRATLGDIFTDSQFPNLGDANPRIGLASDPAHLSINEINITALHDSVSGLVATALARNQTVASCVSATTNACYTSLMQNLGLMLWRRPLTSAEQTRLSDQLTSLATLSRSLRAEFLLKALILSPNHLFRTEIGSSASPATAQFNLTQYEIASLLSFMVWDRQPDAALFEQARLGRLSDKLVLKSELARMVQDPKFATKMAGFATDVLKIEDIKTVVKDGSFGMTPADRQALYASAQLSLREAYAQPNSDLMTPFNSNRFHTNNLTARYFNLPSTGLTSAFSEFTANGGQRHGILSHPAFLTVMSGEVSSGIVRRGVYTLEQLLCNHLGAPPPNAVPTTNLPAGFNPNTTSSREVLRITHSSQSSCIGCHSKIDPAGFGFENFSAFGQFRTVEKVNVPIDASGELAGAAEKTLVFQDSPTYLRELASTSTLRQCLDKHFFKHATGEDSSTVSGQCEFENLEYQISQKGSSIQALLESMIELGSFTRRQPAVQ